MVLAKRVKRSKRETKRPQVDTNTAKRETVHVLAGIGTCHRPLPKGKIHEVWHFRVCGTNGQILTTSETFYSRSNAVRGGRDECRKTGRRLLVDEPAT